MKALLKRSVKSLLAAVGSPARQANTRVLTYHSIGRRDHDMNVSTEDFARQMDWLVEKAETIALSDAAAGVPGIAITFDDGFADNWTNAAPILLERAIPATVFMVTGRAGGHLDDEPDPPHGRIMTWGELRAWQDAGLQVGGHTRSHVRLSRQSDAQQREEIAGCFEDLSRELESPPLHFAYPYGSAQDFTPVTETLVREAGFQCAFSNRYGIARAQQEPWSMRRIWIDRTDDLDSFAAKVTGRLDRLAMLDSRTGLLARTALNSALRRPGGGRRSDH